MSWKTFEEECTSYLNRKYGIKFEQQCSMWSVCIITKF